MSHADGTVLPMPGVPKTLGILNVIFGVLAVLLGTCMVTLLLAFPLLLEIGEKAIKDQQAQLEARQKERMKEFDDREKDAPTEDGKKAIRQERDAFVANTPAPPKVDFGPINDMMKNPTIKYFSITQFASGTILSLVLMISGIGLIRLAPWGRSMAIVWAGVQIVQLVGLTSYEAIVVTPVAQEQARAMLAKLEADAKGPNAAPGMAENLKASQAMAGLATVRMVGWVVIGSVYPVLLLILLNTAGARAACLGRKPEGPAEF